MPKLPARRDAKVQRSIQPRHDPGRPLVGSSAIMRELRERIGRWAATDYNILILGETGTGKELVARALHAGSDRVGGPFVTLNCAAMPDALVEAQLFGHVRGAFTGADRARKGAFRAATGGTLFLDEIGELPVAQQAKVLRAVEHRVVAPVGSAREVAVDVRVVAATHVDLLKAVEERRFRADLYYRLLEGALNVPALHDRREDIPEILAAHGVEGWPERFDPAVRGAILERAYPGNVRELLAFVRALAIDPGRRSALAELHVAPCLRTTQSLGPSSRAPTMDPDVAAAERLVLHVGRQGWAAVCGLLVRTAIERYASRRKAAKALGVDPTTFNRWARKLVWPSGAPDSTPAHPAER